ncbi:unnamed protein product [Rotaria sordida]|uniref:GTP-eEF1A C-terminal domain-containing protein n=1 Tax=Rotaria sordida TaxID=392033 RepID=A0A818TCI4_9BILA|nr:unnamed protein product [Rotaria sordida]
MKQDQVAIARFELSHSGQAICMEPFKRAPQLGRFTLRDKDRAISVEKVLKTTIRQSLLTSQQQLPPKMDVKAFNHTSSTKVRIIHHSGGKCRRIESEKQAESKPLLPPNDNDNVDTLSILSHLENEIE